ncbi:MAG TPA: hypothetical protein VNO70_20540, partial [Blastocatellia bacterium]|nr:hypothetical protein [Blastocatellia bacterium]
MTASNQEIRYPGARTLTPSRLAQYVTRNRCERYMRLFLFPKETDALRNRYHARYEGLSQVMSESGNVFERDRVNELRQTEHISDLMSRDAAAFIHAVKTQPPGR